MIEIEFGGKPAILNTVGHVITREHDAYPIQTSFTALLRSTQFKHKTLQSSMFIRLDHVHQRLDLGSDADSANGQRWFH